MTEDEGLLMNKVGDEFWTAFSKLCNDTIKRVPAHMQSEFEDFLGGKTSIYGRDETA